MPNISVEELPRINDPRGNLTFLEELKHVPFDIKRVYWIYDVPGGEVRGSHAFKEQEQVIIALSGSFDVVISNGENEKRVSLNRSYKSLYIPNGTWRTFENFSTNAVCLVFSSMPYSEEDYIRDFDEFKVFLNYCNQKTVLSKVKRTNKTVTVKVKKPSIYDACIIDMPRIVQSEGSITVVEGSTDLPYDIKRVYYLYDIPSDAERGAHAHKECHRFLTAVSGAFDVSISDGTKVRTIRLERPYYGVYIPPGLWTSINGFSSGAVCVSIASDLYSEKDYIRDYDEFVKYYNCEDSFE